MEIEDINRLINQKQTELPYNVCICLLDVLFDIPNHNSWWYF